MFSIGKGYDWRYLEKAVVRDRESYYQSAVREGGEPPGKWHGKGARALGLAEGSEVTTEVMQALYEGHYDIRDPSVFDPQISDKEKPRLGRRPARYKTADEIFQEKIAAEPEATAERREQLLIEARKEERKALAFFDGTASPPKSYTLAHAGLLALAKQARETGDLEKAAAAEQAADQMIAILEEASQTAIEEWNRLAGWTRTGYHGKKVGGSSTGKWEWAGGWVSASYVQHTNRNGDPQLHVHNPVLNRQLCADGQWRSLDGQAMLRARPQVGAVFDRGLVELSARQLGLRWTARADGQGWEVKGVTPEQILEFSSRRTETVDGLEQLIQAYERKHGYSPNALAIWKMAQFIVKDTKSAKPSLSEIPTIEQELEAWEAQTTRAEIDSLSSIPGRSLFQVDEEQLARDADALAELDMGRVVEAALADVQREKPSFTRYELARALSRHLPTSLGGLPAQRVGRLLEEVTEQVLNPSDASKRRTLRLTVDDVVEIPADRRFPDGRSVYRDPTAERWTTPEQLDTELRFVASAVQTDAPAADAEEVAALLGVGPQAERTTAAGSGSVQAGTGVVQERSAAERTPDQGVSEAGAPAPGTEAAGGGAGRPGSGSVRPGSVMGRDRSAVERTESEVERERLREYLASLGADQVAAVYGVATSGRRVDVLEGYAGTGKSRTVSRLARLWKHTTGGRVIGLTTGQNAAGVLQGEGLDQAYNITRWLGWIDRRRTRLQAGDLVVVDEGSMVTTDHLAQIQDIAEAAGAKILLTGDSEQLSAPGAGGLMRLLATKHGSYELTAVRRFTEKWEREASVRLRAGDQDVLAEYDRRGRIRGGTYEEMAAGAVNAFAAGHVSGKQSIILASTNEDAAELAGLARRRLVELGHVSADPIARLRDGNEVGVGDRITARQNNQRIRIGEDRRELSNRDVLQVVGRHADGRLQARLLDEDGRPGASVLLDGDYVREYVELAYAGTSHAAQGRTLDDCQPVVREGISRQELYVMLSRARGGSTAWVCTETVGADLRPEIPEPAGDGADRQRTTPDQAAAGVDRVTGRTGDADVPGNAAADTAVGGRDGADQGRATSDRAGDSPDLRDPLGVLAAILETDQADETATERMELETDRVTHMAHLGGMWTSEVKDAIADATTRALKAILPEDVYADLDSDPARGSVMTAVRRAVLAGHDLHQVIADASEDGWEGARSIGQVLSSRIEERIGTGEAIAESWTRLTPGIVNDAFVRELAEEMDARVLELGERAIQDPPAYLVERLGEPPTEIMARTEWIQRAGRVQAYREQYGNTDSPVALPPAPERHSPEQRAAWMAASAALGRSASEAEIAGAGDGQLWVWRSDYERAASWAPPHVGAELGRVYREITDRRRQAVLDRTRAQHLLTEDEESPEGRTLLVRAQTADALVRQAEARRDRLEEVQAQREAWHEHTEALRNRAMAADAELRRRHDDLDLPPLHRPEDDEPARPQAGDGEDRPGALDKIKGQAELFGRSVRQWVKTGLVDRPERAEPEAVQDELDLGLAPALHRRRAEREPAEAAAPEVGEGQQSLFDLPGDAAGVGGQGDLERAEQDELARRRQEQVRREREALWARQAERAEPEAVQEELDLGLVEAPTRDSWLDRALERARQARAILRRAAERGTDREEPEGEERRQDGERYRDHLARREEQHLEQRRQEQKRELERLVPDSAALADRGVERAMEASRGMRTKASPPDIAPPTPAPPPPAPRHREGPGLSL